MGNLAAAVSVYAACRLGACLSAPQGLLFVFLKCDEMEHVFKNRCFLEMTWLGLGAMAVLFLIHESLISLILADGTLARAACIFFFPFISNSVFFFFSFFFWLCPGHVEVPGPGV